MITEEVHHRDNCANKTPAGKAGKNDKPVFAGANKDTKTLENDMMQLDKTSIMNNCEQMVDVFEKSKEPKNIAKEN